MTPVKHHMLAGAPTRRLRRAPSAGPCGLAPGAALLGLLGMVGCARVSGIPAGPITGVAGRFSSTFAHTYAPATLEVHPLDGEREVLEGNTGVDGGPWVPLPLRVAGRVSPTRWIDVGADIGWKDAGLQLRAGPLDVTRSVPWGAELEWRTEASSVGDASTLRSHAYRARVEAYPALPLGSSESGLPHAFGVLTAGMSSGTQLLSPILPARFDRYGESTFGTSLSVLRPETRLELGLGLHWLSLPAFITLVVMPWVTLDRGGVRGVRCVECTPFELAHIDGSWGFAVALSSGVVLGPEP